jgi:predicted nucleotidyltransferase
LVKALSRDQRVVAIYLHGSFGTKAFRKDSDVDCALLLFPGETVTPVELMHLGGELGGKTGRTIDLGIMNGRNLVYFVQAVQHGRRIFCRDVTLTERMVANAFSLYAQLREDRREIEDVYHVA